MKIRSLFLATLIFTSLSLKAGELVIKGKYNGKNVFVQNPYNAKIDQFCTQKVFVNDRLIFDEPKVSAYQIDMSYLSVGDLVVLRIEYRDGCEPTIVNPHVLSFTAGFQFIMAQADNNSVHWSTMGELVGGKFEIEQLHWKRDWEVVNTVPGKEDLNNNLYSIAPKHYPGVNHYRIKYIDYKGDEYYSLEFAFTSTEDPVTFDSENITNKIVLSKITNYFITDMNGNEIRKGRGKEIPVQDFKPGLYFLNIENRTERFIKK